MQSLLRRLEKGGLLPLPGACLAAQPFLAAALHRWLPQRPLVVVTDCLKTQESFQQDLETWLQLKCEVRSAKCEVSKTTTPPSSILHPPSSPLFYPAWETLPHEGKLPHADVISERLETLVALSRPSSLAPRPAPVVVTSVAALMQRTFPPDALRQRTRTLTRGDHLNPLDLIEWLEDQGYEPEIQVSKKGELALRGGIVDVFPPTSPWPVRLEFFGDELESLRTFDPVSQVSREEIERITLPPAGELGVLKQMKPVAALGTLLDYLPRETIFLLCEPALLDEHAAKYARQVPAQDPFFVAWEEVQQSIQTLGMAALLANEVESGSVTTGDLSPEDGGQPVDADQPGSPGFTSLDAFRPLAARAPEQAVAEMQRREFFEQIHRWLRQDYAVHVFCNNDGERQRFTEIWEEYGFSPVSPSESSGPENISPRLGNESPNLGNQSPPLGNKLLDAGSQSPDVGTPIPHLGTSSPLVGSPIPHGGKQSPDVGNDSPGMGRGRAKRRPASPALVARSPDMRIESPDLGTPSPSLGTPVPDLGKRSPDVGSAIPHPGMSIHLGTLARGFLCDEARLVVITDAEIFGRYKIQRPRRLKSPHALAVRSALDIDFAELEDGDYVVHLQHGIGRYHGLQAMPGSKEGGTGQECLVIEYAPREYGQPAPRLYVPVTEAHLVSKYVGAGKARPQLNVLGGSRWAKTKLQAEHAVRDLAGELLSIQAARESQSGHAFKVDSPWQREFEGSFIFEETPDQMRAILDAKSDMEKPKPMDRLICGDVGFGKTEVAIRAAFKSVMDGRQVAVLVPTTVLAQQHFNTFRERMADYPVKIEMLSRYRTRRAQQKVIEGLASGAVDIVIGTHRLVQSDIVFKDLGLVVIDEEQRFGVMHKEKFKLLRRMVDVLTLSATPIPRTLYLALTGARDMSTIQTPPHDRLPVETIVTAYDERVIRDAILREMNRGGQVFFLHNRVMTIDDMAAKLRTLVPDARLVVGHGQMHADDLEEVMTKFVNGEADVLLSTTIIESGLDIPNANTIIIDRADRFGLSDLYQLRGRVGRYKHQAFAYLLIPRHARLLTDARKRISALKQYSTLGSGFKIAMRDLEIRGAGNLLGSEQSGHITAVGFELYCQLLKQSVAALKGEKVKPRVEVAVRLDFLALNPAEESAEINVPGSKSDTMPEIDIVVPRETWSYAEDDLDVAPPSPAPRAPRPAPATKAPAYVPFNYIREPVQRIEIYRKLAQAAEKPALITLQAEMRDRFGPLPLAVELLLQVAEIKLLAAERGVTVIETQEGKLKLTRHNDLVLLGGKFPRLIKVQPQARLKEIKKLLLSLSVS